MGMNFKTDLLPISSAAYALGSPTQNWNIYGLLNGTATNAIYSASAGYALSASSANYATTAGNGISNITRSGTTFTVTRADGSSFTFDQQDNNTWRGIQNNLTSTSTTDSLSAYQGKILKDKLDATNSGSLSPASGWTSAGGFSYYRLGHVCYVYINALRRTSSASGWTTMGTLPSGINPVTSFIGTIQNDNNNIHVSIRIQTNRTIQIYSPPANCDLYGGMWCLVS